VKIILASRSPRRKTLLEEAGFTLDVVLPQVQEIHRPGETPEAYALRNAVEKAEAVYTGPERRLGEGEAVLGADTVVIRDGEILEKPRDVADAKRMLQRLSGATHSVCTGVCLILGGSGERIAFTDVTEVVFRPIEPSEIDAYVATGEPIDKAGAYAIQGGAAAFVDGIDGLYTNVVGLPVERVVEELAAVRGAK
jgi:septum formation protein